jgi:hypothetical protein
MSIQPEEFNKYEAVSMAVGGSFSRAIIGG